MKSQTLSKTQVSNYIAGLWRKKDTVKLCRHYFHTDLTPYQVQIVRLVTFDEHPRVVIACMTRYGKSYSVSMGILLWIISHPNKRVAIIAPTNEKTPVICGLRILELEILY